MSSMRSACAVLLVSAFALGFPAACGSGGVVGGECLPGACVGPGSTTDGGSDSSTDLDAGDAGDATRDAREGGGGEPDRFVPDSGGDGAPDDGSTDAPVCTPPHDEPSHCGDCDTQCSAPNDLCAPDGMGGFECVPMCEPPLVECGGRCVDTNIDPEHCGECFNECPSGICQAGMCVGAGVGHVVLGCMNYAVTSQNAAQTRLLGNAVYLPVTEPVRVLAYGEYAPAAVRNRVKQVIAWSGDARGRSAQVTDVNQEDDVTSDLNVMDYDVFLVYDQPNAPADALAAVGAAWASNGVVDSFARAGGVVVVLSGGGGEMDELLTQSGLLTVNDEQDWTGMQVHNRAPADAIGVNVISPFLAASSTCVFDTPTTPDADTIFVFTNVAAPAVGLPVVVHRVLAPP